MQSEVSYEAIRRTRQKKQKLFPAKTGEQRRIQHGVGGQKLVGQAGQHGGLERAAGARALDARLGRRGGRLGDAQKLLLRPQTPILYVGRIECQDKRFD